MIRTMPQTIPARDAATMLGVSMRTVQRWAATGKLPAARRVPGGRGYLEFHRRTVETLAAKLRKGSP